MIPILRQLFRKSYPLNRITIFKDNLISNYNYLSNLNSSVKIAPVLKSNAYGHGLVEIGKIVDKLKAPFLCVDSLYEAYKLKKAGIKTPILIMGFIDSQNLKIKSLPFSYAVWDLELAKVINSHQKGARVHIFVDTGMHREGVLVGELADFVAKLKKFENIKIEGLMSHFANAHLDNSLTRLQLLNFQKAINILE